ncbi:unnamed protein product [Dovyalis caffra]|uniref:ABC transporter domain-containing protein n=1 Tax=Dovyalis caffra TaxID=77055 RepID=A0AAV1SU72_9ROSI|nr:unnamed protein product [Dovyalis caffra]
MGEALALAPDLVKGNQMVASVFNLLDRRTQMGDDGEVLTNVEGTIELRGVKFSYPSRPDILIFKDLDLRVVSGKSMALVGQSGSGKSSVLALLLRFYDPTVGKVMIDGIDIRKLNLKSLREHIGLVQQEPALFATSIYENILYGKEEASEAEVIEAAKLANAHSFISSLPEGYSTKVGERGVQLSGGQKQRVAIARAVLKNPEILLLDEATSALDVESERIVQQALDGLMRNRTTVMVAHRFSTIKNADQISVIQGGKVIEQGTHSSLLQNIGGAYFNIRYCDELKHKRMSFKASFNSKKDFDDHDGVEINYGGGWAVLKFGEWMETNYNGGQAVLRFDGEKVLVGFVVGGYCGWSVKRREEIGYMNEYYWLGFGWVMAIVAARLWLTRMIGDESYVGRCAGKEDEGFKLRG